MTSLDAGSLHEVVLVGHRFIVNCLIGRHGRLAPRAVEARFLLFVAGSCTRSWPAVHLLLDMSCHHDYMNRGMFMVW